MPDPGGGDEAKRPSEKDFFFGKVIGEGSFSMVYLVKELNNGREFAMKVCEKSHIIKENKLRAVFREKHILSELAKHPSPLVITLHATFHDSTRLYFVITYARNGDLLKYIHKVGNFNMDCTRFYSGEILSALRYLHRAGVVHRDLKPENILITERMHVMITDFGSAQIMPLSEETGGEFRVGPNKESSQTQERRPPRPPVEHQPEQGGKSKRKNSFVGTAQYVSPEVLNGGPVSPAMDMWALGCIVYQMVSGLPPYRYLYIGQSDYQIFQSILKLDYSFPSDFDESAKRVVKKLLKIEPKQRATYDDLKDDDFYKDLDFDKLHEQEPPNIVPFLPGTEGSSDSLWDLVGTPGLDETQMSRLLGLHLGDSESVESLPVADNSRLNSRSAEKGIMEFSEEEKNTRLEKQRSSSDWHRFVEGNLILKQGLVDKRKGLFPRRRMLLLTTGPRLYYVDPDKMVLKGQIPWSSALYTEPKNFKNFFVHTPNRTYNLEDPEGFALRWCKAIEAVYTDTYGPRA